MQTKFQRGLTLFAIIFLVISALLLLLLGWVNMPVSEGILWLIALGWLCAWTPLIFFSCAWLIYVGRHYLESLPVWLGFQAMFLCALFGTETSLPSISLLAVTGIFVLLPLLWIIDSVYICKHYLAARFMAWGSIGLVWAILIAWRIHGNLFEVWLTSLDSNHNPLLWLNGVMVLTTWMIFSGLISFFVEIYYGLRKEVGTG